MLKFSWLAILVMLGAGLISIGSKGAYAEATVSCPAGTYDMLDWMTMDSGMRGGRFLKGSANPLFTTMHDDKFYWTKGHNGFPWDIQLFDNDFIYLWITEYSWNDPTSFKKFFKNTNMPLAPRCAKGGFPGSRITVDDTSYGIYDDCDHYTEHNLKKAVNEVWGPYNYSFGGDLDRKMPTLVVSYRYNCDDAYGNCGDKEEYYLTQKFGLVQWVHYTLVEGKYQQEQKSVFNKFTFGAAVPKFQCF